MNFCLSHSNLSFKLLKFTEHFFYSNLVRYIMFVYVCDLEKICLKKDISICYCLYFLVLSKGYVEM